MTTTTGCKSNDRAATAATMDGVVDSTSTIVPFRPLGLLLVASSVLAVIIFVLDIPTTSTSTRYSESYCHTRRRWHRHVEGYVATASFVVATSMRALIPTSTNNRSSSFLDGRYDDTSSLAGGAGGVFSVILDGANAIIDGMESFAHRTWEDDAMQSGALSTGRRKHDDIDDDDDGRRRPSFPSTYYRRRRGNVPEIDMNVHVPCDVVEARKYLLEGGRTIAIDGCDDDGNDDGGLAGVTVAVDRCINRPPSPLEMAAVGASDDDVCRLRDVITRDLLVEYVRLFHDDEFDISTHPIVLRNLWPEESFREAPDVVEDENSGGRNDVGNDGGVCEQREGHGLRKKRRLSPAAIMNDPQLSNLVLPNYFSDAANRAGYAALVPDAYDDVPTTLSHFLTRILSGDSPNAKIGTQVIVDEHPELRDEIIPAYLARGLFGWNTHLEDIEIWSRGRGWLVEDIVAWMCKVLPSMSTYPVFIAGNGHRDGAMGADMDDGTPRHPRTDLHSEPIGNIASQLHGTRRWTLVPTAWSVLLRPTISRHRAYFYSNMDPYIELPERLDGIPLVYECVTRRGDTMWIPPWMWHRVDYDGGGDVETVAPDDNISIGASIFHFYPTLYITSSPLFGFLVVPNLIREVLGFNIE